MIAYHGSSSKIEISKGYQPKCKKGRIEFGTGLYCTCDYSQARSYGRTVYEISLNLQEQYNTKNIKISSELFLLQIETFISKAALKKIADRLEPEQTLTLARCFSILYNNVASVHTKSKEINNFMVDNGAKFTTERSFYDMIIVHDFSIITEVKKATQYETQKIEYTD